VHPSGNDLILERHIRSMFRRMIRQLDRERTRELLNDCAHIIQWRVLLLSILLYSIVIHRMTCARYVERLSSHSSTSP
jgi:hypothetical protein